MKTIIIEMTGSPKEFGFATKEEFINSVEPYGVVAGKLNSECTYLITDDLSSTTSKMVKAKKLGKEILTYGQLYSELVNNQDQTK